MATPKLSIIIPTLHREEYLVQTIKQVLSDSFRDLELIVLDQSEHHNESTQRFLETLDDPRFHYYAVKPISGVAAKNYGLSVAAAEIVVFLDDDITLDPDCLAMHYQTFEQRPDIGGVAGRVKQKGIPITKQLLHFDRFGLSGYTSFNYTHAEYTDTAAGGNMSVRRSVAIAIGGFDVNFVRSQQREESDFCARYQRAGNRFYFEPRAAITHLAAPFGGTRIYTDFADNPDFYRNHLYFILRYCSRRNLALALILNLRFYALRKNMVVTIRRTILFVHGLAIAQWRCWRPLKLTSVVVRQLP